MGDLAWKKSGFFYFPNKAFHRHAVAIGSSGSGKSVTLERNAYGAFKVYHQQVVYLDAKGDTKREDEASQDNAAHFVAAMQVAGAKNILVFPSLHYNGWQGSPIELKNRLLSVIDFSESGYYGDVAANALELALTAPTTPRSSSHFLANLRLDRLKRIYKNNAEQYQKVLALDEHLLQQVEMRYQVFFAAMAGQLDGTLDYGNADAVYLRVRGFVLRNEAPRLGRFLVSDFMHYMSERRKTGVQTLFIIDEFNALRMREETSILFEQVRSFGGNLIISAQGYTGLGPPEYADRILDACSTYILHSSSDPGHIAERAGKKLFIDTTHSEDDDGNQHRSFRPRWDWRVDNTAVMQQEEGEAYWIYKGHSQHVMTAPLAISKEQVLEGWKEIQRQEEIQRQLLEVEAQRKAAQQQAQKASTTSTTQNQTGSTSGKDSARPRSPRVVTPSPTTKNKPVKQPRPATSTTAAPPVQPTPPAMPIEEDDEPDRL